MKKNTLLVSVLLLGTASFYSSGALAQWQWIDNSGRKIYSDQAPPVSIPEANILTDATGRTYKPRHQPKPKTIKDPTYGDLEVPATPVPTAAAQKATNSKLSKEQQLEQELATERQRIADDENAKAKAEQEKRNDEVRAKNCVALQNNLKTVDSGYRIARLNDKGEKEVMDKAALQAERSKILQQMRENQCN